MFRAIVFRCPHLKGSNEGARCDAALCIAENNLIKNMEDADIKLCINKKRRFEACYIYFTKLRRSAISKLSVEIPLSDSRPHAFGSL
ncbi:MAG: hypothetical protein M0Z70_08765 [Nitrospiraceae bacterium]|nr:hypothetical protein [Nitrospiraceae bacterium]